MPAPELKQQSGSHPKGVLQVLDLGRIAYASAYETQSRLVEQVVLARTAIPSDAPPSPGFLLLLEHDPVITISRRPGSGSNLLATAQQLADAGVTVQETDRGGDITYHGPGQLVAYPILDLNALGLRLHDYMRLLESVVIDVCGSFGVPAHRDACATGVWVGGSRPDNPAESCGPESGAKVCAMGVRVRQWVSMHGLALNVFTDLDHFRLIVPCGLVGRPVTSLAAQLGPLCPSMAEVKSRLAVTMQRYIDLRP